MLTIELPEGAEAILAELANASGQSKEEFARRAILQQMEDREDAMAAEAAIREFDQSGEPAIPIAQVIKDLGLED
jgi:predicted DNA-binding protein